MFGYRPQPDGAGWKMERFDFLTSNKEKEFAGSDFLGGKPSGELKTQFRPSDVTVGPEGAIYVADWFDARVGGHGTLDDGTTGTIYRIAPKGFQPRVPRLDLATTEGQLAALKSPAVNVRFAGFTRLKAQGEKAVDAVAQLLKDPNPYLSARAVWLLAQMGPAGVARATPFLDSSKASERLVAFRALRAAGQDLLPLAHKLAEDPSAAVRREVAVSLRDVPAEKCLSLLVALARQFDGQDRAYLEALGLGAEGKEGALYAALPKPASPAQWTDAFTGLVWRLHPDQSVPDIQARLAAPGLSPAQRNQMLTALGFIPTKAAADAMLGIAANSPNTPQEHSVWWLFLNSQLLWKDHDVASGMKARGIYDPEKTQWVSSEPPPIPENAPILPPPAEIAKLTGDPVRGAAAGGVCFMCHRIGATGIEFGPDLTTFASQQTREVLAQAIAQPSADIAHGYEGFIFKTADEKVIHGILVADGDPVVVLSVGGMLQRIPKAQIVSRVPKRPVSLMYEPAQLGLDAQRIADIIAWLKSLPGAPQAAR